MEEEFRQADAERRETNMAPEEENPNASEAGEPRQDDEKGRIARELSALADRIAKQAQANREQDERHDNGRRFREYATLVFIILTTVGVFIQACIFGWQLESSDKEAHIRLRAYVFSEAVNAFNVRKNGDILETYTYIKDVGITYAKIDKISVGMIVRAPPEPDTIEGFGARNKEIVGLNLAPNSPYVVINAREKLTDDEFEKIFTVGGVNRIYVFGRITYIDIFGDHHRTDFCHMYFGNQLAPREVGGYLGWQAHACENPKLNYAD